MDDQVLGSKLLCPLKICGNRMDGLLVKGWLKESDIGEIGHVKKNREKGRRLDGWPECFDILLIKWGIFPSPRVSGEELDGFTAPDMGSFNYFWKTSSNGNMKSKPHRRTLKKDWLKVTIYYVTLSFIVNKKFGEKVRFFAWQKQAFGLGMRRSN